MLVTTQRWVVEVFDEPTLINEEQIKGEQYQTTNGGDSIDGCTRDIKEVEWAMDGMDGNMTNLASKLTNLKLKGMVDGMDETMDGPACVMTDMKLKGAPESIE